MVVSVAFCCYICSRSAAKFPTVSRKKRSRLSLPGNRSGIPALRWAMLE